MSTLPFTFGGELVISTLDGDEIESEIGPRNYRALYDRDWRGRITRLVFEINEARPGKPEYWVVTRGLPDEVMALVEDRINQEYRDEQRRILEQVENEA